MKALITVAFVSIVAIQTYSQTIRRVNNNPGVTGVNVYTTPQAAHDAAAANDVIIIEPSPTSYGNLQFTKTLKVHGNGYYLTTNKELKADQRESIVDVVSFLPGSEGSVIDGVVISGISSGAIRVYGVSNITIQRCHISSNVIYIYTTGSVDNNISNIVISQNYLRGTPGFPAVQASPTAGFTISNVLIANNVMDHLVASSITNIQNWVVRNNTFLSTTSINLVNSVFENNLLVAAGSLIFSNVSYNYNVSSTNSFSGGTANQNNFAITGELLGSGAGISTDEAYQIKSGSVLKTAGSGGVEVGAFGGLTPYIVSGIPPIPSIVSEINTSTGSNTVPLQVTISVKSNN